VLGRQFEVSAAREGDVAVVSVSGDVDIATADELRDALLLAGSDGASGVRVDLTDVEFMDSTGLNALVIAHKTIGQDGRRLVIVCPDGAAWRALEISGLHEVLHVQREH
jgi:anti-sigma B factor antagonist